MKRNVAHFVFVHIVAFVFVPEIFFEIVHRHGAARADIKSVIDEIVVHHTVFHTVGIDFHCPPIVFEIIFEKINFRGAIKKNGSRVVLKSVMFYFTETDVFQKQAVIRVAPVVDEIVGDHSHVITVHYCNSCIIVIEGIAYIHIVVRGHKVEAIS